jgi:hypothetical protein
VVVSQIRLRLRARHALLAQLDSLNKLLIPPVPSTAGYPLTKNVMLSWRPVTAAEFEEPSSSADAAAMLVDEAGVRTKRLFV